MVYRLHVEAASIASVTLTRKDGAGDFDIEVADSVSPGNWYRASVSGLIARDSGSDVRPNVVLIPPSLESRTVYVHVYVAKNAPGKWLIDTRSVDLVDAAIHGLVTAGGQHLVEEFVKAILEIDTDSAESKNIGWAVGIGFSIIQGKSMLGIGIDTIVNEIQLKLQDEFPNNKLIVLAGEVYTRESRFLSPSAKTSDIAASRDRPDAGTGVPQIEVTPATFRGVRLPARMTPACLDELAGVLNRHSRGDDDELDAECAVRVFEVVLRHLG